MYARREGRGREGEREGERKGDHSSKIDAGVWCLGGGSKMYMKLINIIRCVDR